MGTGSDRCNVPGGRRIGALLAGEGCGIIGLWAQSLRGGTFRDGLLAYRDGNYPVLHLTAEALMGGAATIAGLGLWTGAPWGRQVALFALGALSYSSINSSGWALHNRRALAIPMGLTLATAAVAVPFLLQPYADRDRPTGARRGEDPDDCAVAGRYGTPG